MRSARAALVERVPDGEQVALQLEELHDSTLYEGRRWGCVLGGGTLSPSSYIRLDRQVGYGSICDSDLILRG